MATKIQHRRKTAAQWTTDNTVLAAGEPGFELDTGREKRGDGTTAWNSLAYMGDSASVGAADIQELLGWNFDSAIQSATSPAPTLNQFAFWRWRATKTGTIGHIYAAIAASGVGLTAARVAVLDPAGTVLGKTDDLATDFMAAAGVRAWTPQAGIAVTKDNYYYGAMFQQGTTAAQFRGQNSSVALNAGCSASKLRAGFKTAGAATDFGASIAGFSTMAALTLAPWLGFGS